MKFYHLLQSYGNTKQLKHVTKIIVPTVVIAVILYSVEIDEVKNLFLTISIPFFILTLSVCIFDQVTMGLKWNILLKAFKVRIPFHKPIIAYLRGKVFELFIPSIFGIDTYKSYYVKEKDARIIPIVSSIFVERFVGMLSSLAVISLLIHFTIKGLNLHYTMIISLGGLIVFFVILIFLYFSVNNVSQIIKINLPTYLPTKLKNYVNEFFVSLQGINGNKYNVFVYFIVSIFEKLFYGTAIYFSARAIGLHDVQYIYIISAAPFLSLLERLPISISAIGVKEGLYIILLKPYGIDVTSALTVALVLRSAEICYMLISSFFWIGEFARDTLKLDIKCVEKEIIAYGTSRK